MMGLIICPNSLLFCWTNARWSGKIMFRVNQKLIQ